MMNKFFCRHNHSKAFALIYVVIIFFLCYSPEFLVYEFLTRTIEKQHREDPICSYIGFGERWAIFQSVSYFLMTINASVNMIVYCFKDEQFRKVAMEITGLERLTIRESSTDNPTSVSSSTQIPHCLKD